MKYEKLSKSELQSELDSVIKAYDEKKALGLKINMARGCPCSEQLDLSRGMLTDDLLSDSVISKERIDIRNYGCPQGLLELRELFAPLLDTKPENMIVGGSSSLNLMYNIVSDAMLFGFPESNKPWGKYDKIKFICPCPGYDRHFAICEALGIEMIPVRMLHDGPDMDEVERLVSSDETVKGMWCVPKYSNPLGITFDRSIVKRIASLSPAAKDFKVFWDNAYCIHDLYDEGDSLLNIFPEAEKAGNANMVLMFASTAKVTFPGGGVSFIVASDDNISYIKKRLSYEIICFDKINQMRHVRFFKTPERVLEQMKKHASIIRPKFELVYRTFANELGERGIAEWTEPNGGYFISLDVMPGTAQRTWALASEAGVTLTNVGATFPYRNDPDNKNIRIAPTYVSLDQLERALEVLCLCARRAALEKLISNN